MTLICQDNVENEAHKNIISYFKTYAGFNDAEYAGSLVRKSAAAAGQGKNKDKLLEYPQLNEIYEAFKKAGEELAVKGRISRTKTQWDVAGQTYPAAKAPPGTSGIFFDRSRHVESIVLLQRENS